MLLRFSLFILLATLFVSCNETIQEGEILKSSETGNDSTPGQPVTLVSNSTIGQRVCERRNELVVQVHQSKNAPADTDHILCYDNTQLSGQYEAGAKTCKSGVQLNEINFQKIIRPCQEATICGVSPADTLDLGSGKYLLTYTNLPWGCSGQLLYFPSDDVPKILDAPQSYSSDGDSSSRVINIDITPPTCSYCEMGGEYTCDYCGTDTTPPVIKSVTASSPKCNVVRFTIDASDGESGLPIDAFSFDGGVTWQANAFKDFEGLSKTIPANLIKVKDFVGTNIQVYNQEISGTAPGCPCELPWGEKIGHEETKDSYKVTSVLCGQTCDSERTTLECRNGTIVGSKFTHPNRSCTPDPCPTCDLSWGDTLIHGGERDVFSKDKVKCEENCNDQKIQVRCDMGVLKNKGTSLEININATPVFNECEKQKCKCSLPWGGEITDGTEIDAFESSSVACGQSCDSKKVKLICRDGKLFNKQTNAENTTHRQAACEPVQCLGCQHPWDSSRRLNHGESAEAFGSAVVACGSTCQKRHRTCNNGNLSEPPNFQHQSCTVSPCLCRTPGGLDVLSGSKVNAFSKQSVTCNETCPSPVEFTCNNGTFSTPSGANITAYFSSCNRPTNCTCPLPWGGTVQQSTPNTNGYYQSYVRATNVAPGERTCDKENCWDVKSEYDKFISCDTSGNLVFWNPTDRANTSLKVSDYKYDYNAVCGAELTNCHCTTPDGIRIGNKQTKRLHKKTTTMCGESCSSTPSVGADFKCTAGTISSINPSSGVDVRDYPFPNCSLDSTCGGIDGGGGGGEGDGFGYGSGKKGSGSSRSSGAICRLESVLERCLPEGASYVAGMNWCQYISKTAQICDSGIQSLCYAIKIKKTFCDGKGENCITFNLGNTTIVTDKTSSVAVLHLLRDSQGVDYFSSECCSCGRQKGCSLPWGSQVIFNQVTPSFQFENYVTCGTCDERNPSSCLSNSSSSCIKPFFWAQTLYSSSMTPAEKDTILDIPVRGQVLTNAYVPAYNVPEVSCGDKCSNHLQVRKCLKEGYLSGGDDYQYPTCVEAKGCP